MILEYHMIREDVNPPTRANPSDAGLDIFYSPDTSQIKSYDDGAVIINPGECAVLSTGLKFGVPHGYMLEVKNKSGIASKRQLVVGACVVDPGYDGEIYVNLHNIGVETQIIKPGDKIAQAVLVPVVHCDIEEATEDNLNNGSTRGEGGFGSTGDR